MEDILSQGGDGDDRHARRPRRVTVIVALIVLVAGGALFLSSQRHQHAPAAARQSAAALPSPVIPPASAPPGAPPGPSGITGRTLAWDRGLRLPAGGARPVWFSPASGRSVPIAGLPPDPSGYQFIRVNGGWAVQSGSGASAQCGGCAGVPLPVWFLADGARSATPLGTASLVAPAAEAGAVWLTSYPPDVTASTAAGTAREVRATGAPAQSRSAQPRQVRLPRGYAIVRGTDRGLLLTPVGQPLGTAPDTLWDPSAHRAGRAFNGVVATSAGEIAQLSPCAPRCGVQLLDLATGKRTLVALPAGSSAVSGAFSPDGGYLALQVSFGTSGDGGELAMQLEVAPVTTGRLAVVPGTWASSDALIGFGWPASGDSLVSEFSFTTKMELASWHPGTSYPAVKVIPPGPSQAFYILG